MKLTRLALSAFVVFAVACSSSRSHKLKLPGHGYRESATMRILAAARRRVKLLLERFQGPLPEARSIAWTRVDMAWSL